MFCLLLVSDGFCQACVEVPDFSIQHRHKVRAQFKSFHWWFHHHFTTRYSPRQTWTNLNLTCLQCPKSQQGLRGKYSHHFTTRYSPMQTWTNLNLTCLQCPQSQRGMRGKYSHHFTTRYSPRQTWTNLNLTCLQCPQSQRGLHGKYRGENPRVQSCPRGVRQRRHTEEQQQLTIRKIHPAVFQCVGAIYKLSLPTRAGTIRSVSVQYQYRHQPMRINMAIMLYRYRWWWQLQKTTNIPDPKLFVSHLIFIQFNKKT